MSVNPVLRLRLGAPQDREAHGEGTKVVTEGRHRDGSALRQCRGILNEEAKRGWRETRGIGEKIYHLKIEGRDGILKQQAGNIVDGGIYVYTDLLGRVALRRGIATLLGRGITVRGRVTCHMLRARGCEEINRR